MTINKTEPKGYRKALFCLVTTLYWASLYTYSPIFTPYLNSIGAANQTAGIIVGSYGFTQMIFRIPLGIISDKLRKRKLFVTFGLIFSLISETGLFFTHDLNLILLFRALAGAAAATWVDYTILYASYYPHEESTRAIGTLNFFNTLGQTIAMFFGGLAADYSGWSSTFAIGIGLAIIGFVLSLFVVEKYHQSGEEITFSGVMKVAANKTLITVSLLAILSQAFTFATVFGFTPQYANMSLHLTKLQLSLLTVFSALPTAFSSLLAGTTLTRKFGEKRLIILGFLITGAFTAVIPFTHSYALLIITQIFAGFGRGLSFPLLMGLSIKDIDGSRRSTAMGFFQAIYGLGMFVGPVIMGYIGDFASLQDGFVILGVLCMATSLIAAAAIKKRPV